MVDDEPDICRRCCCPGTEKFEVMTAHTAVGAGMCGSTRLTIIMMWKWCFAALRSPKKTVDREHPHFTHAIAKPTSLSGCAAPTSGDQASISGNRRSSN